MNVQYLKMFGPLMKEPKRVKKLKQEWRRFRIVFVKTQKTWKQVSVRKDKHKFWSAKSSFCDWLQPFPFAPCWPGGLCDTNSKQVFCVYSCLSLVESPHHYTDTDHRRGIFSSLVGDLLPMDALCIPGLLLPHAWGRALPSCTGALSFCPLPQSRTMPWLNMAILFWRGGEDFVVISRAKSVAQKCWHLGIWVRSFCTVKKDNNQEIFKCLVKCIKSFWEAGANPQKERDFIQILTVRHPSATSLLCPTPPNP